MGNKPDIFHIIYNGTPLELVVIFALAAICLLIGGAILLYGDEFADNINRRLDDLSAIGKVVHWIVECLIWFAMIFVGLPLVLLSLFVLSVGLLMTIVRSGIFLAHIVTVIFYKIIALL